MRAVLERLLPGTLFGRLMAVLLLGLVGALSLSTWISLSERDDVLRRAAGLRPAERVSDLVELLDPLPPAERERLVRVLDNPALRVKLLDQPLPLPTVTEAALAAYPGATTSLSLYTGVLRSALGEGRALQVQLVPAPNGRPARGDWRASDRPAPGSAPVDRSERADRAGERDRASEAAWRHRRGGPPGLVFVAQVQLAGPAGAPGQWLRLDTGLPHAPDLPLRMLAALSVLLLAVLALSWWAVRRITRPLRLLADAAEALGRDLAQPPLPETGPQEVRSAHRAFNTMQARLRAVIDERTHVLAAVSHDLKTPLTRMRLRAELLDDETLREPLTRDLDEMTHMVNDTLDFLRGLSGSQDLRPVDLEALLESLRADQEALGRHVTLQASQESVPRRPWHGDAVRLRRCLGNLLDNAALYGQHAELSLVEEGDEWVFRIRDAGPGIPEAMLEQVFEPFFRLEASRNRHTGGSGLGLGIARHIARAAGGELTLRNHPQGGLEAAVRLPRRP
ncbi:ATP-binding protein [Ideonella sp.]|uniref:ATP-binding protein n=1 Tax=Ideonella sp. TaxID=1929293 RepID=UPI003BB77597